MRSSAEFRTGRLRPRPGAQDCGAGVSVPRNCRINLRLRRHGVRRHRESFIGDQAMTEELRTSDSLSKGLPISAETAAAILADRIAGLSYVEIASKRSVHFGTARRVCKRA